MCAHPSNTRARTYIRALFRCDYYVVTPHINTLATLAYNFDRAVSSPAVSKQPGYPVIVMAVQAFISALRAYIHVEPRPSWGRSAIKVFSLCSCGGSRQAKLAFPPHPPFTSALADVVFTTPGGWGGRAPQQDRRPEGPRTCPPFHRRWNLVLC